MIFLNHYLLRVNYNNYIKFTYYKYTSVSANESRDILLISSQLIICERQLKNSM